MKDQAVPLQISKWYSNGPILDRLIREYQMKNLVVVGSSLGATTLHLGELVPFDGKVFAVDSWSDESQFQQFLSNVTHAELTGYIVPVRMDHLRAANEIKKLDLPIDLIYLDAPSDYFSMFHVLRAWFPYARKRSHLCGSGWNNSEAQKAIIQFALENNQIVHHEGGFWMFL